MWHFGKNNLICEKLKSHTPIQSIVQMLVKSQYKKSNFIIFSFQMLAFKKMFNKDLSSYHQASHNLDFPRKDDIQIKKDYKKIVWILEITQEGGGQTRHKTGYFTADKYFLVIQ